MPIYEYHCEDCGKDFECLVFGDETPECTGCKSSEVRKLMSACGFVSKGSAGETTGSSAAAPSCSGCSSTNCASCGQ
jgi:putative FmdB family regulatory protein